MNIAMIASMVAFLEATTGLDYDTLVKPIIEALSGTISWANISVILVGLIGACVGLVFSWWAVRKGARALMVAFKKGKISI